MDSILETKKEIMKKILELENYIVSWSATHSQSNPGAVMELRHNKKVLAALYEDLRKINAKI
jgi:hypothetical protein